MRFDVLTLFPEIFQGYLTQSLLKLALAERAGGDPPVEHPRLGQGKHQSVDDRPFGGGPGMVIMPEPVFAAVEAVQAAGAGAGPAGPADAGRRAADPAAGAASWPGSKRLLLLCGRYEGFDERIRLGLRPREISIGDFVCNGGEVPAMVVIDTVIRYVPGVLGDPRAWPRNRTATPGRLEYPQYTRPRVFRGMAVPEVLLSGNHQAIARWRQRTIRGPQPAGPGPERSQDDD